MADVKLTAVIEAEDRASATIAKVGNNAQGLGKKISDLKPMFKTMATAGTIAFGVISGEIYAAVSAANEAQKVQAQLNAVIKSTGGVAGVTADQVLKLSTELQKTTTFNDEVITSAQNLLLTFTKIGKDVFPDATKAILDMSTALGQDTKASAIQLGKALNDPIRGVNALRKVGVSFTEEQQEQIKVLVESGRTMEAQKLILAELATEFGGSASAQAETFAGKVQQLKNRLDDMQQGIGEALIPIITKLVEKMGPTIDKIIVWIEENPKLTATILVITAAVAGLVAVLGTLGLVLTFISVPMLVISGIIIGLIAIIYMANEAIKIWQNDSELVIAGVKAYWEDFKNFWIKLWDKISAYFKDVWGGIKAYFREALDSITGYFQPLIDVLNKVWDKMTQIAQGATSVAKKAGKGVVSGLTNFGHALGFAEGGIVTRPTLAMIGEAGEAEAVIPLSKLGSMGGGRNINIHISGAILTDEAAKFMGDRIVEQLRFQLKF